MKGGILLKSGAKFTEQDVREANIRLHRLISSEYNQRQALHNPAVIKNLKKFIHPFLKNRRGVALDAGCGTGYVSALLTEYDFEIVGFDLTEEMVAVAMKNSPNSLLAVGDSFSPPFPYETFDLLLVSGVLHHVLDYRKMLERLIDHLKKESLILILNEPNPAGYAAFRPLRFFTRNLIPEKRVVRHVRKGEMPRSDEALAEYHIHHGEGVSPEEIAKLLERRGFSILQTQYTNMNMIANMGDRISLDILSMFPILRRLDTGRLSFEFNIAAERKK